MQSVINQPERGGQPGNRNARKHGSDLGYAMHSVLNCMGISER